MIRVVRAFMKVSAAAKAPAAPAPTAVRQPIGTRLTPRGTSSSAPTKPARCAQVARSVLGMDGLMGHPLVGAIAATGHRVSLSEDAQTHAPPGPKRFVRGRSG